MGRNRHFGLVRIFTGCDSACWANPLSGTLSQSDIPIWIHRGGWNQIQDIEVDSRTAVLL